MKNFLKTTFTILFVLIGMQAFGQSVIIKAGLNLSNMQSEDDDFNYLEDSKFNPGFHVGALFDLPVAEGVSVETGIMIENRGFRVVEEDTDFDYKATNSANLLYANVPISIKAQTEINDGFSVFGNVGPYIGVGLSGKTKTKVEFDGDTSEDEEDVEFGSDENDSDLKRLDYGLTVGGGVEINNIVIGLGFDLGLANLAPDDTDNFRVRNRTLKVSVGFRIGGE